MSFFEKKIVSILLTPKNKKNIALFTVMLRWVTAAPNGAIVLSLPADLGPFLTVLHSYTHKIRVKRLLTAVTSSAPVCSVWKLEGSNFGSN